MQQLITFFKSPSPMVQLHMGVALLGVSGLFAKLISLPATDIIAYRCLLTTLVLYLFLKISKTPVKLRSFKDYKVAFVLGLLAGAHWVTYFISIQKTSVAIGMITLFTYPVITALIEPLFRKQLPSIIDLGLSLLVLFAISLLFPSIWQLDINLSTDYVIGVSVGLLSALCFALRNIGIQHYFKGYSGAQGMFYQFLVTAIICLPFVDTAFTAISFDQWYLFIIFAIFFSAAPHVLFAGSISHFSAKTAGLIACLQPLYGITLGLLILAEQPSMLILIGGSIIIAAAIYETTKSTKRASD